VCDRERERARESAREKEPERESSRERRKAVLVKKDGGRVLVSKALSHRCKHREMVAVCR